MNKKIYLLYSCNQWKEYSSMSIVVATTSLRRLKSVILECIKSSEMNYGYEENSRTKQINDFKKDLKENGLDYVENLLQFGFIDVVIDGEVQ